MRVKDTQKRYRDIADDFKSGMSKKEIREKYGVCKSTVCTALQKHGLIKPKAVQKMPKKLEKKLPDLIHLNHSGKQYIDLTDLLANPNQYRE